MNISFSTSILSNSLNSKHDEDKTRESADKLKEYVKEQQIKDKWFIIINHYTKFLIIEFQMLLKK